MQIFQILIDIELFIFGCIHHFGQKRRTILSLEIKASNVSKICLLLLRWDCPSIAPVIVILFFQPFASFWCFRVFRRNNYLCQITSRDTVLHRFTERVDDVLFLPVPVVFLSACPASRCPFQQNYRNLPVCMHGLILLHYYILMIMVHRLAATW